MGPEEHVEGVPDYEGERDEEPQQGEGVGGVGPFAAFGRAPWGAGEGFGGGEVGRWEFGFVGAGGDHGGAGELGAIGL